MEPPHPTPQTVSLRVFLCETVTVSHSVTGWWGGVGHGRYSSFVGRSLRQFTTHPRFLMFSFLRRFLPNTKLQQNCSPKKKFIQLTNFNNNSPLFVARSKFDDIISIYQGDIGSEKQRTHICGDAWMFLVKETPEEILRLLDQ